MHYVHWTCVCEDYQYYQVFPCIFRKCILVPLAICLLSLFFACHRLLRPYIINDHMQLLVIMHTILANAINVLYIQLVKLKEHLLVSVRMNRRSKYEIQKSSFCTYRYRILLHSSSFVVTDLPII